MRAVSGSRAACHRHRAQPSSRIEVILAAFDTLPGCRTMGSGGRWPRFVTQSTINLDWPPLGWFEFLRTHSPPMETESTVVNQPSVSLVAPATLPVGFGWFPSYGSRSGRSRGRRPRCAAPCASNLTYRGLWPQLRHSQSALDGLLPMTMRVWVLVQVMVVVVELGRFGWQAGRQVGSSG